MEGLGLLAGLLTGLASSVHCVGVCSGISVALLAGPQSREAPAWRRALGVHGGRMLGYTLAGAAVGLGGGALSALLSLAGQNETLRWLAAASLAWTGLSILGVAPAARLGDRWLPRFAPVSQRLGGGALGPLVMGLGWSLTPCGMVYLALFNASLTGGPLTGAGFMAAFALGTLPALGAVSIGAATLSRRRHPARGGGRARLALGLALTALAPLSLISTAPEVFGAICRGL